MKPPQSVAQIAVVSTGVVQIATPVDLFWHLDAEAEEIFFASHSWDLPQVVLGESLDALVDGNEIESATVLAWGEDARGVFVRFFDSDKEKNRWFLLDRSRRAVMMRVVAVEGAPLTASSTWDREGLFRSFSQGEDGASLIRTISDGPSKGRIVVLALPTPSPEPARSRVGTGEVRGFSYVIDQGETELVGHVRLRDEVGDTVCALVASGFTPEELSREMDKVYVDIAGYCQRENGGVAPRFVSLGSLDLGKSAAEEP